MSEGFTMPYPCFLLASDSGTPQLIEVDGHVCLCLFTSRRNVEAFYRGNQGIQADTSKIKICAAKNRDELIKLLTELQPQLVGQDCKHVAFDAVPGSPIGYVLLDELLRELGR